MQVSLRLAILGPDIFASIYLPVTVAQCVRPWRNGDKEVIGAMDGATPSGRKGWQTAVLHSGPSPAETLQARYHRNLRLFASLAGKPGARGDRPSLPISTSSVSMGMAGERSIATIWQESFR